MVGLYCRDRWLATERPAAIFISFLHSTRIFLAKAAVYMHGAKILFPPVS